MKEYLPEGRRYRTPENQRLLHAPEGLLLAWEHQIPLEGIADHRDRDGNLWVTLGNVRGVIPCEETAMGLEEGLVRDAGVIARVGSPVTVLIDRLEGRDGKLLPILSRKKCQERCWERLSQLPAGTILPATVTRLEPFGAFVDVGCGIPSLIGIEQISVSRILHPDCRFYVGQEIRVLVTGVIESLRRVTLSHRELLGTWEENAACFAPGDTVAGTVRSVMEYGLFVELTPNLSGLAERTEGVEEGTPVTVCIKSIQPQRMKIKLAILSVCPEPVPLRPLPYCQTEGVLSHWQYGPEGCLKRGTAVWDAQKGY